MLFHYVMIVMVGTVVINRDRSVNDRGKMAPLFSEN